MNVYGKYCGVTVRPKCLRAGVEFLVLSLPSCVTRGNAFIWLSPCFLTVSGAETSCRLHGLEADPSRPPPTSEDVIAENTPDRVLRWFRLLMQSAGNSAWVIESYLNVIYCGCQLRRYTGRATAQYLQKRMLKQATDFTESCSSQESITKLTHF